MSYKLDLESINREDFSVTRKKDKILIVPKRSKFVWENEELVLRSLLVNPKGEVISSGFPKFFNVGERPEETAEFMVALSRGEVKYYNKEDGSLIILDLIDGKPHFRTRGCHDLGSFEGPVMDLIYYKYPRLLSPENLDTEISYLFEYVGPDNRIVLNYREQKLVGLGLIDKVALEPIMPLNYYTSTFNSLGVIPVENLTFKGEGIDVLKQVADWTNMEGVVAWYPERFMKIKSSWYVKMHHLKFQMTDKKLFKYCYLNHIYDWDSLCDKLIKEGGFDYESLVVVEEYFKEYKNRMKVVDSNLLWIDKEVQYITKKNYKTRKEQIQELEYRLGEGNMPKYMFHVGIRYLDKKYEEARTLVIANEVLEESGVTVQRWLQNAEEESRAILKIAPIEAGEEG